MRLDQSGDAHRNRSPCGIDGRARLPSRPIVFRYLNTNGGGNVANRMNAGPVSAAGRASVDARHAGGFALGIDGRARSRSRPFVFRYLNTNGGGNVASGDRWPRVSRRSSFGRRSVCREIRPGYRRASPFAVAADRVSIPQHERWRRCRESGDRWPCVSRRSSFSRRTACRRIRPGDRRASPFAVAADRVSIPQHERWRRCRESGDRWPCVSRRSSFSRRTACRRIRPGDRRASPFAVAADRVSIPQHERWRRCRESGDRWPCVSRRSSFSRRTACRRIRPGDRRASPFAVAAVRVSIPQHERRRQCRESGERWPRVSRRSSFARRSVCREIRPGYRRASPFAVAADRVSIHQHERWRQCRESGDRCPRVSRRSSFSRRTACRIRPGD